MYPRILKRKIDILVSAFLLLILLPLFILIGAIVYFEGFHKPFFFQTRIGKHGKPFTIYKFRSMLPQKKYGLTTVNNTITVIGGFLRRYKLDELPQLLNILKGEMSFVGPRPGLPSMSAKLDYNGKIRLKVRPGLTGWADVNGGIYLPWPERWVYDRFYVENLSFRLDLKIFLRTFNVVLFGENFYLKRKS